MNFFSYVIVFNIFCKLLCKRWKIRKTLNYHFFKTNNNKTGAKSQIKTTTINERKTDKLSLNKKETKKRNKPGEKGKKEDTNELGGKANVESRTLRNQKNNQN